MLPWLKDAPEVIKGLFDILDLVVFRLMLLVLASLGAYSLIKRH